MAFYLSATLNPEWEDFVLLVETSVAVAAIEFKRERSGDADEDNRNTNNQRQCKKRKERELSDTAGPSRLLQELPQEFKNKFKEMCGENNGINMVIQKRLYKTDVARNNNRLSMPFSQIASFGFLTEGEMKRLNEQRTIEVSLIHKPTKNGATRLLEETNIELRQWDMHKSENKNGKKCSMYVLKCQWYDEIVEKNELKAGDEVQIWASRKADDNRLCMALVTVSRL